MIYTDIDKYLEANSVGPATPTGVTDLTVVATSGAFDIITPGHIELLRTCKTLGDYVVVFLNSEMSIKQYKGKHRPVKSNKARAEILDAIRYVGDVVLFSDETPKGVIWKLKPDIWVKGNRPKDEVVELETVWANGGVFISLWTNYKQSTTSYIDKAASIHCKETGQKMVSDGAVGFGPGLPYDTAIGKAHQPTDDPEEG